MKLAHRGTFVIAWDLVHGFLASSCPKTKTQITPHTPILIHLNKALGLDVHLQYAVLGVRDIFVRIRISD